VRKSRLHVTTATTTTITLTAPRHELVRTLAGILAEAATPALVLERPGEAPVPLAPRATDLPALLRDAPVGTRLHAAPPAAHPSAAFHAAAAHSDSADPAPPCTIELVPAGCAIHNPGRLLIQAAERIRR
ncbi:MAG: hypothetical protein K2X91_12410, partial [Thermoleophilia bacterium]|nr:hypothetical protein [Thermoleophilia bacterium]